MFFVKNFYKIVDSIGLSVYKKNKLKVTWRNSNLNTSDYVLILSSYYYDLPFGVDLGLQIIRSMFTNITQQTDESLGWSLTYLGQYPEFDVHCERARNALLLNDLESASVIILNLIEDVSLTVD